MTSTAPSRPIGGGARLLTAPAVAGVAYLVAWVVMHLFAPKFKKITDL